MLQPKRTKFRKQMTSHNRGLAQRGSKVSFGEFALKSVARGRLTAVRLSPLVVRLTRHVKRGGKSGFAFFPDKPVSKKPLEVRMGKGKGGVEYWVARFSQAKSCYEIEGVSKSWRVRLSPWRLQSLSPPLLLSGR